MFEARIAQFYRSKGYEVHENPRVRGASENVYAVAMVAEGPLGALLISFGDAGGVDAAEVGRVRTMARDIGATPVLAAPNLSTEVRRLAAQMGVVLLDEATVGEGGPLPRELPALDAPTDPIRRDLEAHPWPASGRAFALAGPAAAVARDVDELVAELHRPQPPPARPPSLVAPALPNAQGPPTHATPPSLSAAAQTLPAPSGTPSGPKFAWLGGGTALLQPSPAATATVGAATATGTGAGVDLSTLLGVGRPTPAPVPPRPSPPPAVEHESSLLARPSPLRRIQERAYDAWDHVRDWPWRTITVAGAGAGLLVVMIRWIA